MPNGNRSHLIYSPAYKSYRLDPAFQYPPNKGVMQNFSKMEKHIKHLKKCVSNFHCVLCRVASVYIPGFDTCCIPGGFGKGDAFSKAD